MSKTNISVQPEQVTKKMMPKRRLMVAILFVVLLVAALAYAIYYYYPKVQLSRARSGQDHSYTYKTLKSYTVKGLLSGNGLTFMAPTEMVEFKAKNMPINPVGLQLSQKLNNQPPVIGAIKANSAYISDQLTTDQRSSLIKALTTFNANSGQPKKDQDYIPYSTGIRQIFNNNYTVVSTKAASFQNNTIKDNAWQWDFTATITNSKTKSPTMKGKVIIAIGKTSIGYLVVYSTSYNWQHNQAVWQRVFDSFKINQ